MKLAKLVKQLLKYGRVRINVLEAHSSRTDQLTINVSYSMWQQIRRINRIYGWLMCLGIQSFEAQAKSNTIIDKKYKTFQNYECCDMHLVDQYFDASSLKLH